MMISGLSSTGSVSFGQRTAQPQAQPAGDQISMSLSAETFSSLVHDAGQMPEVRGEVVDAFKARIQSGEYPTPATMDGLTDFIGSRWTQFSQAGSDVSSS